MVIEFKTGALCFQSSVTQTAMALYGVKKELFTERNYSTGSVKVCFAFEISLFAGGGDVKYKKLGEI